MDAAVYLEIYKEINKLDNKLLEMKKKSFLITGMIKNIKIHKKELLAPIVPNNDYLKRYSNDNFITLNDATMGVMKQAEELYSCIDWIKNEYSTFDLKKYKDINSDLKDLRKMFIDIDNFANYLNSWGYSKTFYMSISKIMDNLDDIYNRCGEANEKIDSIRQKLLNVKRIAKR